jgi:ubiquinone/menaquinone biosynthesis C-methylase UbiE
MEKQVDKTKYQFEKYCNRERWSSYYYQLGEILKLMPSSVLEIGIGDSVVASYLKQHTGINHKSLDIADDLKPDIMGSIDAIPLPDNSFDLVCAFEVLEHLPFERFPIALKELYRVAKKNVLISLPHWGRHFSLEVKLPGIGRLRWQKKINWQSIPHEFKDEHYWEIGKRGYKEKMIKEAIKAVGFKIIKDYIAFDSPYHHFFILKKI